MTAPEHLAATIDALERYAHGTDEGDAWVLMSKSKHTGDAVTLSYPIYGPKTDAMWRAFAAAGFVQPPYLDYIGWGRARGDAPITPHVIATMTRDDLMHLLTKCQRGERFYDGYWQALLDDGTFLAIARRLAQLESERPERQSE